MTLSSGPSLAPTEVERRPMPEAPAFESFNFAQLLKSVIEFRIFDVQIKTQRFSVEGR